MQYSRSGDHAMQQPLQFCDKCLKRVRKTSTHWIGGEGKGLHNKYLKKERSIELIKLIKELEFLKCEIFNDAINYWEGKLDQSYVVCAGCKCLKSDCKCLK